MRIRTDLAMESGALEQSIHGITTKTFFHGKIEETQVSVDTKEASILLEKAMGQYITFYLPDLYHAGVEERKALIHGIAQTVGRLLPSSGDVLVIGLGNRYMTADALGSRVLENLLITRHIKEKDGQSFSQKLRGVCAAAPGVLGVTGMETAEIVKGMKDHVHPSAVIAIDALDARESSRICTTVQITDTGILPGSGVGNHRAGLTEDTLGVPVIAIGVPMVVYASVIARDALLLLMQDMGMGEEEHEQAVDGLMERIVQKGLGDLVVTPREVDELVGKVARIIADGLNIALQPGISEEELQYLTHDGP